MIECATDWEPCPPAHAARVADEQQRLDAWLVTSYFARAADGHELARTASDAMSFLESAIGCGSRLVDPQALEGLQRSIAMVRARTTLQFPLWDSDTVADGIAAAVGQAIFFGADHNSRQKWKAEDLADLRDLSRRLRNDFHSAAIGEQMAGMRESYRAGRIDSARLRAGLMRYAERIARNDVHNSEIGKRLARHQGAVHNLIPKTG